MSEPITMEEVLKLVSFDKGLNGQWRVKEVLGDVDTVVGDVWSVGGNVRRDVKGTVGGNVNGNVRGNVLGDVWGNVGIVGGDVEVCVLGNVGVVMGNVGVVGGNVGYGDGYVGPKSKPVTKKKAQSKRCLSQ